MEVDAVYLPVDVKKMMADKQNSVVVPMKMDEPDGSTYLSLNYEASGGAQWGETVWGSHGVRVPIHRIRPMDGTGAVSLVAMIWHAREELAEQFPKLKHTEAIGVAFDPEDTDDVIHFGLYVKMR